MTANEYTVAIIGAEETAHCDDGIMDQAKNLGHQLAFAKVSVAIGSARGFPLWVAMGVKEKDGHVVEFSPAATKHEHETVYNLKKKPYSDLTVYTGFGISGRDLLMLRSVDAVIAGCLDTGSLATLLLAQKEQKPLGVLAAQPHDASHLGDLLQQSFHLSVTYDRDPNTIITKLKNMA